jgi:hypothetical protein
VSDRGGVDAIDAETGGRLWSTFVGDPDHPTLAPAADDRHVAVVNGTYLYVLEQADGSFAWRRQTRGVPGAGPAINERSVFLPMWNGALETYSAQDPSKPASVYRATGRAVIQPIVTARAVAWPTDLGHLYVAPSYRDGIWYRVEGSHPIAAAPAYSNRTFYLASTNGFIYAIDEMSGSIAWTYSAGEALSQSPVAIGDAVYVIGEESNLHCLSADFGQLRWTCPDVRQFLAHGTERVYCVGRSDNLLVLQPKTGAVLASSRERLPPFRLTNTKTDRIYVASQTGLLQCLRETGSEYPILHVSAPEESSAEAKDKPSDEEAVEPIDPFGESTSEGAAPIDPFGDSMPEEENPFDTPAEPTDPFGEDPP